MKETNLPSLGSLVKTWSIYKMLGYKSHHGIKQAIMANIDMFESFGSIRMVRGETTEKGGRPVVSYLLNIDHVLILSSINKTATPNVKAKIIRAIIDIYAGKSLISAIEAISGIDIDCNNDLWVYVAKEEVDGRYKVGISNDPERRVNELNVGNPNKLVLVHCYQARDGFNSEKLAHSVLRESRIRGEWFDAEADLSKLPSYNVVHKDEDCSCDCADCRSYSDVLDAVYEKGDMSRDQFISIAIKETGLCFDTVAKHIDALFDTGVIQFAEIIGKSQILSLENKAV